MTVAVIIIIKAVDLCVELYMLLEHRVRMRS